VRPARCPPTGTSRSRRPLATHAQHVRAAIQVAAIRTHELGQAQARRVRQLEQRAITRGGGVAGDAIERAIQRVGWQRARQPPRQARERQQRGRVGDNDASAGRRSARSCATRPARARRSRAPGGGSTVRAAPGPAVRWSTRTLGRRRRGRPHGRTRVRCRGDTPAGSGVAARHGPSGSSVPPGTARARYAPVVSVSSECLHTGQRSVMPFLVCFSTMRGRRSSGTASSVACPHTANVQSG